MKQINALIIILLCLIVIGFFANFAQNDYGMQMVSFSCLLLSVLFYFKTYSEVKPRKYFNIFLLLSILCGLRLVISIGTETSENISFADMNVYIFLAAILIFLFVPMLIIPIWLSILERKLNSKTITINYFLNLFVAMFCLSIYLKGKSLAGAGVITVMSGFVIFPMLFVSIKMIIKAINEKAILYLLSSFSYLFIGVNLVAFVFKSQHWPGSNLFLYTAFLIFGLFVLTILLFKYRGNSISLFWNENVFTVKTLIITFIVTTTYVNFMRMNLVPGIYSNFRPKGFQELVNSSDKFTKQGKANTNKAEIYRKYYEDFMFIQRHSR